jgi:acyl-CoA thioesterase FadM
MDKKPGFLQTTINSILWGNSVALAWTWGLGLFFAVQVTIQFGVDALFKFATIDAVGLALFGVINHYISKKYKNADDFENSFIEKSKNYSFVFFFYQFLAITMTIFACLKYITLPLGIFSILAVGMFFGITIFLGEELDIKKIKFSHAVFSVFVFASFWVLINSSLFNPETLISAALSSDDQGLKAQLALSGGHVAWYKEAINFVPLYKFNSSFAELAFWIPIAIGFLCGPWLDLQNWQRVIQIKKENGSVFASYIVAGIIFWVFLMLDGFLALACYKYANEFLPDMIATLSNLDPSSLFYSVKSIITLTLGSVPSFELLLGCYILAASLFALSTFDSGYIAYKWYASKLAKDSNSIIFSFIPPQLITSPLLGSLLCVIAGITTLHFTELGKFVSRFDPNLEKFFSFELEYYMAFYASFFVIYSVAMYRDISNAIMDKKFLNIKLFAGGLSSLAFFGIGYFQEQTILMALGGIFPFIYGFYTHSSDSVVTRAVSETSNINPKLITAAPNMKLAGIDLPIQPVNIQDLPPGAKPVNIKGCYVQHSFFVHQFIPTYQDTNSVGNVYFAMYSMWVGKTRELFFLHTMPGFDPKTSPFLILTRDYNHKFLKEINEFTEVEIRIRIKDFNRKFVTLEHEIVDKHGDTVGKGSQGLMFVDSKDYSLLDIPLTVQLAFKDFVVDKEKIEKMIEKAS